MKMRSVWSSHVDAIKHDPKTSELHVRYKTGKTAIYAGVTKDVASTILQSPSIGGALHAHIKGRVPHRYL